MQQKSNMGQDLLKHLSHPHIDKSTLKNYAAHLEKAGGKSFRFERIWWKGIPFPDILKVQTRVPVSEINELQKLITRDIKSIEIFPIGIPVPEYLQAIINIPLAHGRIDEKIPGK